MIRVEAWSVLNIYNFFIALVLFIFAIKDNTSKNEQSNAYIRMLLFLMILIFGDYLSRFFKGKEDYAFFARFGNFLVFAFDPMMAFFILEYINTWIVEKAKKLNPIRAAVIFFSILNLVLVSLSEMFDLRLFYFYVGADYLRGEYFLIRAIIMVVEFLTVEFYILYRTRRYKTQETTIIRFFLIPSIMLAMLQIVTYNLALEYTGIVLYTLILYIYVQSKNASIDFLTGLVNRRIFDNELENRIRLKADFSGIMIDVDYFKRINDNHGHQEGDNALTIVSEIIYRTFRKSDVIARYGGDEFCVLTDITDITALEGVIKRFRSNMDEYNRTTTLPYKISLSLGYDVYRPEFKDGTGFINYLDEKMYKEKKIHHSRDLYQEVL